MWCGCGLFGLEIWLWESVYNGSIIYGIGLGLVWNYGGFGIIGDYDFRYHGANLFVIEEMGFILKSS
ncbi:hypothetical protein Bca4012_078683 [Brassica carinata]|uniref:Uncharacterized protein n=1 Tax=Brassica carinata TaxID=52824 RepID=A0A8X7Q5J5_BRACI|nr:hypothetical protein Bca52824_071293 [Brassica carinata]